MSFIAEIQGKAHFMHLRIFSLRMYLQLLKEEYEKEKVNGKSSIHVHAFAGCGEG